ncbi:hypothetical protein D3C84_643770 [compost metagenome]
MPTPLALDPGVKLNTPGIGGVTGNEPPAPSKRMCAVAMLRSASSAIQVLKKILNGTAVVV